jgi:hypothetical protein
LPSSKVQTQSKIALVPYCGATPRNFYLTFSVSIICQFLICTTLI